MQTHTKQLNKHFNTNINKTHCNVFTYNKTVNTVCNNNNNNNDDKKGIL